MIYCPKCGTANRDGSRFCNECGASLPHTGQRCPECGTFNPTGTVFCDECGARLVPPASGAPEEPHEESPEEESAKTPIKGLSLPTIPLENEGEAPDQTPTEEPDWMSQLRAGIDEEGEEAAPAEDLESIDIPDWLGGASEGESSGESERVVASSPFPPGDNLSAEDAEEGGGVESASGPPEGDPERGEEPQSPSPFVADEEVPETVEIPEWLTSASSEPEGLSEEGEVPEGMDEPAAPSPLTGGEDSTEDFEDVEIPEWLRGMSAEEPSVPSERAEEPETSAAPPPFASTGSPPEDAEIPDWLQDMAPAEEAQPSAPETPPKEEAPPEPSVPEAPEPAPEPAQVPDWLQDMAPAEEAEPMGAEVLSEEEAQPKPSAPEAPEPAPEPAQIPDWLRDMAPGEAGAPTGEPEGLEEEDVPPSPAPAEREPTWLEDLAPGDEEAEEVPQEDEVPETPPPFVGAEELPEGAEIPAWLMEEKEEPTAEEVESPEPTPFAAEEGAPAVEAGELPDWLMEMKPDEEEEPAEPARRERLPETEPLDIEGLAPAQIPAWLEEMRPSPEEPEEPEGTLETEGLLEGLRGTLQASSLVEAREPVGAPPSGEPSPVSVARAELLQELVARPAAPVRPEEREPGRGIWWFVQKLLVGIILLAAVIAPIMEVRLFDTESALPANGLSYDAIEVYETLERQVDEGTPVLVAFEYGSSEAVEMDVIAGPLMRHLLDRGARVIVVSTHEQGPALADRLVSSDAFTEEQAERVVNLGYQPGWEAGVQDLLADLSGRSVYLSGGPASESALMEGVTSAQDVGVVLVLAGRSAGLRAWVEQITARFPDLPVVAGISARVEPGSRPYVETTGQLQGIVSGLTGAASYESQLGAGIERASFYLDSLTLAHLAVAGLMVLGAFVFLVGGRRA